MDYKECKFASQPKLASTYADAIRHCRCRSWIYMFVLRGLNDETESRCEFLDSLILQMFVIYVAARRARRFASEHTSVSKFPTRTIWLCPPPQCAIQRNIKWSFTYSFATRNAPRVFYIFRIKVTFPRLNR